jgi:ssDNA thymidine ADP-ribosyltransferase, DarT
VTAPKKSDSAEIEAHIRSLKRQSWLGEARLWWPDFLFRFDNIDVVARILSSGRLLSRAAAMRDGVMLRDSASPEIIAVTPEQWKKCARLYFRPRSPTQFNSEGFRPAGEYHRGAQCPVPVVMLFRAVDILTRADAQFSNGNLATSAATGDDVTFLRSIPFEQVYHDSWFSWEDRGSIIFHRHAEVIVPDELDLAALRFIGCRTQAEYETLIYLLDKKARNNWSKLIGLGTKANLHYRRWTFVEDVKLTKEEIHFRFNPSSETPGPFHLQVKINEVATGKMYLLEKFDYTANSSLNISLKNIKHSESYTVELTLDGQLAYANHYEEVDIPF